MTPIPRTDAVLHDTANDFRALGSAVKQDLDAIREQARNSVNHYSRKVTSDANQTVDQLRDYAVSNPIRALAYAALGGVVVGLFLRR